MYKIVIRILIAFNIVLMNESAFCQSYGIGRLAFANSSKTPIKSMIIHRSKYGRKKVKQFDADFDKRSMYISAVELYNAEDNIESESFLNPDKEITNYVTLEYDSLGRIMSNYFKYGSIIKREYIDNYEIRKHFDKQGELVEISAIECDTNDKIVDWLFLSSVGDTTDRYKYDYDENGNEICFIRAGPQKRLQYKIQNSYNSKNQLIQVLEFDWSGKMTHKRIIEINEEAKSGNKENSVLYRKNYHTDYTRRKSKEFVTETIDFLDEYGNVIKRYTNENCNMKGDWQVVYVDYEY